MAVLSPYSFIDRHMCDGALSSRQKYKNWPSSSFGEVFLQEASFMDPSVSTSAGGEAALDSNTAPEEIIYISDKKGIAQARPSVIVSNAVTGILRSDE